MGSRITTSKVRINASASRVWKAITEPEQVRQWQYGAEVITDWQVGSPIVFRNEWENTVFEQKGKILEIEPGKMAKYTLFFPHPGMEDKPENYFTMSYLLEESEGQTMLTIIQDDPREQMQEQEPLEESEENSVLDGLKKLIEG
ncbi:SRPBCC domain-containing protein [Ktedonospora formicarum]|uniref:Activator of Hsp90 ATPase homologue 1/2-like C-terminal domain-containing protein n=1 Tax=Ktedonospora formicarum TaxID=2778364 RepID=A0A8J3I647_9CHLR|nr:SRPBCC domain-containing protein [Ktedonospora formicarum]GHO49341.1 hypothetical protein KSX_75040 [Ktedonospora formicarum]